MTELEQQLTQALEQLQQAYEQQFSELNDKMNSLANSGAARQPSKNIPDSLRLQEQSSVCLDCKHGKFTEKLRTRHQTQKTAPTWAFKCLMDFSQEETTRYCTHEES
jgi:hypothetical protein